jgi:hypothetical protein
LNSRSGRQIAFFEAAPAVEIAVSDGLPLDGRHILVVEDQYLLARDACEWLEAAGAEVIGLGNGPAYEVASRLAERESPVHLCDRLRSGSEAMPRLEKPFRGTDLVQAVPRR